MRAEFTFKLLKQLLSLLYSAKFNTSLNHTTCVMFENNLKIIMEMVYKLALISSILIQFMIE